MQPIVTRVLIAVIAVIFIQWLIAPLLTAIHPPLGTILLLVIYAGVLGYLFGYNWVS